jgi:hypothetical protein
MLGEVSNQLLFETKLNDLVLFKKNLNPNLFPYSLSCNYHGIKLNFKTNSVKFIQSIKNLIPVDWICESDNKDIIYLKNPAEFNHTQEYWSEEICQDCFSFENNTIAIQRDFASQLFINEVLLICEDTVGDGFYNFLRWYLSEKLMDIGKYVVHASCVLGKDNSAHLFLGHSGAGKTTITKLSHPRLVLGDDMNLVSIENNVLYVEAGAIGGQFNSMIGYEKKMPVKACYWLKQDLLNERLELDHLFGNQKILASFANLHWPTLSQKKIDQLMNFSFAVSSYTQFYDLKFLNTPAVWEYLDP